MSVLTSIVKSIFSARKIPPPTPDDAGFNSPRGQAEFANHMALARAAFPGVFYDDWLKWFHQKLNPATYVEIGIETGRVLAHANPPTLAIGIDPDYHIEVEMRADTRLFRETSDDFFRNHDLPGMLGQRKVEFAFIDGLHTFDQALKDFINLERLSKPATIILFHDVQPVVPETADRNRHTMFWVGDTWKVMAILKKFRPDLTIFNIPAYPSGLGVVTQLDPASTALAAQYEPIIAEAMEYALAPYLNGLKAGSSMLSNDYAAVARQLGWQ